MRCRKFRKAAGVEQVDHQLFVGLPALGDGADGAAKGKHLRGFFLRKADCGDAVFNAVFADERGDVGAADPAAHRELVIRIVAADDIVHGAQLGGGDISAVGLLHDGGRNLRALHGQRVARTGGD
ncbi:hypothetical protein DSECCO2_643000 [anaerobic digester metagenome]